MVKYIASIRQPKSFLKGIDEIKVEYNDRNVLYDYTEDEDFINKDFIIYIPKDILINWDELEVFAEKLHIKLMFEDYGPNWNEAKTRNFKYGWSYPVTTYWEFKGIAFTGGTEILLGGPLYFNLPSIKKFAEKMNINLRLTANLCYDTYIPGDGVKGTYVRPEDVKIYEKYITTLEFITTSLKQEKTLIEVYKRGIWSGNLNLLLTNLFYDIDNRGFDKEFAETRIKCKQKCQEIDYGETNRCNFCRSYFNFITAIDQNKKELKQIIKDREKKKAERKAISDEDILEREQMLIDLEPEIQKEIEKIKGEASE